MYVHLSMYYIIYIHKQYIIIKIGIEVISFQKGQMHFLNLVNYAFVPDPLKLYN